MIQRLISIKVKYPFDFYNDTGFSVSENFSKIFARVRKMWFILMLMGVKKSAPDFDHD